MVSLATGSELVLTREFWHNSRRASDAPTHPWARSSTNRWTKLTRVSKEHDRVESRSGHEGCINLSVYVSNSNQPNDLDTAGEIYKMRLDGTMIGKFGRAGNLLKEFGTVNAIDCRSQNMLYVGEVGNFRVQKLTMR
jgi:hypothetical protein